MFLCPEEKKIPLQCFTSTFDFEQPSKVIQEAFLLQLDIRISHSWAFKSLSLHIYFPFCFHKKKLTNQTNWEEGMA